MHIPSLILFDFDGTLADTAPDLAAAANQQRLRRGLEPLPFSELRPVASHGARGLLRVALGLSPEHADYEVTRQQFLADYAAAIAVHTRLFDGVTALLEELGARGISWGIVTNKATVLTHPLVDHLGLRSGAKALVCGDTTPHIKPHPEPLLHAARAAGHAPETCWYVGDDLRDIQAGHAAGMYTVAAAWGYCGDAVPVESWQAHRIAAQPQDLQQWLRALR